MTSLLSSPPISISQQLFRHRYSNSGDTVACSPSFSFPATRVPWRACWQAITLLKHKHWPNFIDTDSNTFLRQMLITLLHLSLKACFMSLLVAGLRGFSTSPSFNFFGFGSFVILAIIEKSDLVNVTENIGHTTNKQTYIEA